MDRDRDKDMQDDDTIRDGDVIIEERMNRREGLVEYDGLTGDGAADAGGTIPTGEMTGDTDAMSTKASGPGTMQAGASVFDSAASRPDSSVTTGKTGGMSSGGSIDAMSNDNTRSGGMDSASSELLSRVQEKMKVVDANGDDIGKIDYVAMGDPQAVTTAGQEDMATDTIVGGAAQVFGGGTEPDVPEPFRSELLREGFIKIDGKGWFDTDRYLRASDIADVTADEVRLRVAKESLPGENG
ncbi:MAG: hypothetical protein M3P94_00840 [Chloroflexota bacterium]|nr:hypothetical protein [Chloroflexota bacterium]